ncbi:hypothetical protein GCM10010277_79570 [Streptomyces longisporoflavus]|uniref:hypothetical protein n=1 Tax=Streptomyces longisporoflavus TaxID=28044 RepID=UPI00167D2C21|nr:hypothetical protein [Streptomyces longisporoflavus]GGV69431.1 hypothetical protein GCM10010277_79570 [Streptomyces longisporoflavus]
MTDAARERAETRWLPWCSSRTMSAPERVAELARRAAGPDGPVRRGRPGRTARGRRAKASPGGGRSKLLWGAQRRREGRGNPGDLPRWQGVGAYLSNAFDLAVDKVIATANLARLQTVCEDATHRLDETEKREALPDRAEEAAAHLEHLDKLCPGRSTTRELIRDAVMTCRRRASRAGGRALSRQVGGGQAPAYGPVWPVRYTRTSSAAWPPHRWGR